MYQFYFYKTLICFFLKQTPLNKKIVQKAFEDANNFMKDGILLRQAINEIDKVKLSSKKEEQRALSLIYENFLRILQSAGCSGEFYTPRAITDFVMKILEPKPGEKIADLACGTGGFLISAYHYLNKHHKNETGEDFRVFQNSFYGIEKKALPFILCATGFLINGLENPNLEYKNAFDKDLLPFDKETPNTFDIITMNPPYGGKETPTIIKDFPTQFQSSETSDLFMAIILESLNHRGKAAVVLPDGFLFGNDKAKINLKAKLLDKFDLNLILRLPAGVFAPYTNITTNILFFENNGVGTQKTWFYRLDMPEGIKQSL